MRVLVQGAGTHVVEQGDGRPVVFLHGNPDTSEVWDGVLARLPQGLRCLAPDLPGFGASAVPAGFDGSIEACVAWMDGLIEATGVRGPVDLVVHDVGGPFGLSWAVSRPARVRRVVVANTVYDRSYRWHFWGRVWRTPLLGEVSMALMNGPLFRRELRRAMPNASEERLAAMYARITPTMKRTVLQWYRAATPSKFAGWDERGRALLSSIPSLVLWGDRDPYIGREFAETFGAREVRHFPKLGHFLMAEEPETFAAAVAEFLLAAEAPGTARGTGA
jgi:pimeloyl-ACP methyl ester carboxylesterase